MAVAKSLRAILVGDPPDPTKEVVASELLKKLEEMEAQGALNGGLYFEDTLANLNAVTGMSEGDTGFVLNDGTSSNNGVYLRGASSWAKTADLPAGFSGAAIASTDITDSTSAGRTLLTAADAAAQRTALGLGTAATTAASAYATAAQGSLADATAAVTLTAAGLVTGGGTLASDRTFTVTEATEPQARAGTASTVAMTPRRVANAMLAAASVMVWTTLHPATVGVSQSGHELFSATEVEVWTTRYSTGAVEIDETGNLPALTYPEYTFIEGTDYTADPTYVAPTAGELHHWLGIGQSFAIGECAAIESTSAEHTGVALMLNSGVVPLGAPASGFADLIAQGDYESPCIAAVNTIVRILEAATITPPRMVASVAAQGGEPYLSLMRGSGRWREAARQMREIAMFARAAGEQPVLAGLLVHEGEADAILAQSSSAPATTDAASVEMTVGHIMRWRQDYADLAKAIYGQTREPVAVLHLTNRSYASGALKLTPWQAACLEAERRAPHLFTVAAPTYGVEFDVWGGANEGHPTATGYRRLGEMMGRAAVRLAYGTGFQPCAPLEAYWTASDTFVVECNVPYAGSLTIDTSGDIVGTTGLTTSRGFTVIEKDGTAHTVSSVSVSFQSVTVQLAAAGAVGQTVVGYACRGPGGAEGLSGDNTSMARGLLRGSVAHSLSGSAVSSYDWLCPFTITI